MLPGAAAIPAVYSERLRLAEATGRQAVVMAQREIKPDAIMTAKAFTNALTVLQAIGGSTNALIHVTAIAARMGVSIDMDGFDALGRKVPVLVDLKPSGQHYMEHLYEAGGLNTVLCELKSMLHLDALTVTGDTLGTVIEQAQPTPGQTVVKPVSEPIFPSGGIAVLHGNLAPGGAIIKHSSATPGLLQHSGRAVVFTSLEDLAARVDSPDLDVTADDVLVLQNAGPIGAPGMPEAGYLPIPKKLAQQGVKDMVRISDARMSGTAFGTIVLHIVPEAALGGPLALVRDGDRITLDVSQRLIQLEVSDAELALRRQTIVPRAEPVVTTGSGNQGGYRKMFIKHVTQADVGCDFDFMLPEQMTASAPVDLP